MTMLQHLRRLQQHDKQKKKNEMRYKEKQDYITMQLNKFIAVLCQNKKRQNIMLKTRGGRRGNGNPKVIKKKQTHPYIRTHQYTNTKKGSFVINNDNKKTQNKDQQIQP